MTEKEIEFRLKITPGDVYRACKDVLGTYVCRMLCSTKSLDNEPLSEPVFICPNKVEAPYYNPNQQALFLLPEDNIINPTYQGYEL